MTDWEKEVFTSYFICHCSQYACRFCILVFLPFAYLQHVTPIFSELFLVGLKGFSLECLMPQIILRMYTWWGSDTISMKIFQACQKSDVIVLRSGTLNHDQRVFLLFHGMSLKLLMCIIQNNFLGTRGFPPAVSWIQTWGFFFLFFLRESAIAGVGFTCGS